MATQTFNNFAELQAYIDLYIKPNGLEEITGQEHQNVETGLLTFLPLLPLNGQKAQIRSGTSALSVSIPVNIFIAIPSSLTWVDNIYNQYIFVNTTLGNIPLLTGTYYYDINLQPIDFIAAKSIVNICKATNNLWIVASVPYSGSNAAAPPLIGTVGGGTANDPAPNQSIFQSNKLIGLGSTNNGKIKIEIDDTIFSNFGINSSFTFNNVTGQINLSPNIFIAGSGLYINLNQ